MESLAIVFLIVILVVLVVVYRASQPSEVRGPQSLRAHRDLEHQISFEWLPVPGAATYKLQVQTPEHLHWTSLTGFLTETRVTLDKDYKTPAGSGFRVCCYNAAGVKLGRSKVLVNSAYPFRLLTTV